MSRVRGNELASVLSVSFGEVSHLVSVSAVSSSSPVSTASVESGSLWVSELYRSIQGESTWAGWPCAFVRLTGCPLRCSWCDSAFAFSGGRRMAFGEIFEQLEQWGIPLVEVTGGEPLVQPACPTLLTALCDAGYTVLLETSGAFDIGSLDPRVIKVMDVKCPGSGEVARNRWENLALLGPRDELKFVLCDRTDYDWAKQVLATYALQSRPGAIGFAPVHGRLDPAELTRWILEDGLRVRLNLQLHKVLWPGQVQGV